MKFLITGFGSIGRRHFRNLRSMGQQDILFLRSGKSQLEDDELAGYVVERDIHASLSHKPNAVIVANPTALHLDVALPAAQAGCSLLIEKPISHTLDRVSALTDAVQASGSRVLVGFQYRYHPGLRTLKELLDSGEMGNPLSVTSHWGEYLPDWHPWEDYRKGYSAQRDLGGGVVLTLSHPFDYLRWLIGEVVLVSGKTKRSGHLDIDVEDQADINLEFRNGVHGAIHLDYLERPASHWLEIGCSKGTLHWNSLDGLLRVKFSNGRDKEFPVPEGFERNDLFLAQTRHFIDVITGKANPICTLEDGIKALQIALAVHSSSRQGKSIYL